MTDQQPQHRFGGVVFTQLSVMMFLQFFVWGAWYVTMGPYMNANGMDGKIAMAYTVGPIAAIISPFFLGMIADRFFSSERVLASMHMLGGIFLCLAPMAAQQSENLFIVAILAHMLCYMPTLGLTSSLAMHNMTNSEKQFPMIRGFGTIGW
ncbi:MAG: MFS transporter, partial [Phycisphaerae bacterium]|nr:MFS transporter [Phycisphaerae bacterium]